MAVPFNLLDVESWSVRFAFGANGNTLQNTVNRQTPMLTAMRSKPYRLETTF